MSNVNVYGLATVGVVNMITENGASLALATDNINIYPDVIALFRVSASGGTPPPTSTTTSTPTTLSTVTTTTGPSATGWNFLGCYTDNVGGRTLVNGVQVEGGSTAMSVELCQAACKANGYSIAGVEYSGECCRCIS